MYTRWRILGELTTNSPLHIGSGDVTCHDRIMGKAGEPVDVQAVVKDCQGRPCIPGTALKGVLRAWAEQRLPGEQSRIDRIFGSREIGSAGVEAGWAEFCTATLKDPSHEEVERFAEFVPYWQGRFLTGILSHVCIDRHTGAARHNKLFYEEFVPEGITFDVEIAAARLTEEEIGLLLAILSEGAGHATHPYRFGANGADGWGRMSWNLDRVMTFVDREPVAARGIVGFERCQNGVPIAPANVPPQATTYVSAELVLNFDGPFLVNDASRANHRDENDGDESSAPDFLPLMRPDGGNWFPASSFRGVLRQRAEFLLRSLRPDATGDPNDTKVGNGPIERIFGKTSQASALTIDEFTEEGRSRCRRQDFVAIDRFTGGAADGAKFDALFADRPKFRTTMCLDLSGLQPADVAILGLALYDLCRGSVPLGWGGSKGYGNCTGQVSLLSQAGVPSEWKVPETLCNGRIDEATRTWLKQQLDSLVSADQAKPQDSVASPSSTLESTLQGTLSVTKTKRGFDYSLSYERGGKSKKIKVTDTSQIQPDLVNTPVTDLEVDFEFQGGKPARVRRRGEVWATAGTIDASPPVTDRVTGAFANPYYFIRLDDRKGLKGELADNKPTGHKRYLPDRYSGTIRVKLTVETPLLICDDETADEEEGHKTYEVRCQDGKPLLASSSVRGMLRSAYEAITNSRFGVFPGKPPCGDVPAEKHGRRLGFRLPASQGLNTVPIRIVASTSPSGLAAELLPGSSSIASSGAPVGSVFAAWCGMYGGWIPPGLSSCGHRDEVWAYLTPWHYHRTLPSGKVIAFDFWNVEEVCSGPAKPTAVPGHAALRPAFGRATPASWDTPDWHRGYLCMNLRNMQGKHDERFFFTTTPLPPIAINATHVHQWRQLIENYQEEHQRELECGLVRPPVLSAPNVFSRHISQAPPSLSLPERELRPNDLCYAEVEKRGGAWTISALYPVIISRKLYGKSAIEHLPPSLRSAISLSELSPADRVFGWVSQDETAASGGQEAAYRSHVRIGPVECLTKAGDAIHTFTRPKTLAILGRPKPQQGRFYLGDKAGKSQRGNLTKEQAGYTADNRIRGPKIYPHHAQGVIDDNAFSSEPSNQNRSIKGWVNPCTEFEFDLHFTNLSRFELAALVWMLSLPQNYFLRLGLGKPLGFGSVRAEIEHDKTVVANGAEWINAMPQLHSPDSIDVTQLPEEFEKTMGAVNPDLLSSFAKASRGFGDLPIHYPRLAAQNASDGEHFQWFVENERGATHYSLPDLTSVDASLPENPS